MQQNKIIIVFILLGSLGLCLEERTKDKNGAVKNKKSITKKLYHINLFDDDHTIITEDKQLYEKKSLYAVLRNR